VTDEVIKTAKLSEELRMWAEADVIDMGNIEDLLTRAADAISQLSADLEAAREALAGMVAEWDKMTRYGSPLAKAANENLTRARAALAKLIVKSNP
jgi:hypothetical protein